MKKIAIIFNQAPHGTSEGRDALDLSLAISDLNKVSIYFVGDGLLHLLPNQNPATILQRDYISTLKLFEIYDINDIYVCQSSLEQKKIFNIKFNIQAKILDANALKKSLSMQDVILKF